MRELDDLLLRWLEQRFDAAGDADKSAFQALLELPDPELVGYLLNKQQPESKSIARIVRQILGSNPA